MENPEENKSALPGYGMSQEMQPNTGFQPQMQQNMGFQPQMQQNMGYQQPQYVTHTTVVNNNNSMGGMRQAIPQLPMPLAIVLCVINFILPGIGTIIAAFSVLCCGNVGESGGSRFGTFCINFWVGLAQIVLIFFFIGWVWSIMWGLAFIAVSGKLEY
ncbi:protein SPEC3-like [Ciona intestinalis]